MTQRKCGTCRFFEEGGIAASGWCRHPERQELQHMVLVRKTELACRDGWDNDLWEPRPGINETYTESANETSNAVANNHHTDGGDDRSDNEPASERRARVFRPRDDYARSESTAFVPQWSPDRSGGQHSSPESGQAPSAVLTERDAPAEKGLDQVQNETISTRGFGDPARWRRELAELRQDALARDQAVPPPPLEELDHTSGEPEPITEYQSEQRREASRPTFRADSRFESWPQGHIEADDVSEYEEVMPRGPVAQSGLTDPFDVPDEQAAVPRREPELDRSDDPVGWGTEPAFDDAHGDSESLNGASEPAILSTLTKCCRTCRDFRPSGDGQLGWCNNPYAFSERQQVHPDDLACKGSFGSWWAPADDWWMERADISHHSAPTPLVEQFIREMHQRQSENSTREGEATYDTPKRTRRA